MKISRKLVLQLLPLLVLQGLYDTIRYDSRV